MVITVRRYTAGTLPAVAARPGVTPPTTAPESAALLLGSGDIPKLTPLYFAKKA
jgi:hypothetical protein